MKTMIICPNCKRVKDRADLIRIEANIEQEGEGIIDKLSGFIFKKKETYCCNDCYNSKPSS